MVALIVGMSIAAILMSAAMPVWSQMARREKEAELIFRGQQYARAIGLFQRKAGPGVLPPNVDVLVEQRFLRKKYKDPITGEDFAVVSALRAAATPPGGRSGGGPPASQGAVGSTTSASGNRVAGGVMGVASTSTAESLRTYNGATHYDEWQFVYVQQAQAPGGQPGPAGQRGAAPPGGRGDQAPAGQRGNPFGQGGRGTPGGQRPADGGPAFPRGGVGR